MTLDCLDKELLCNIGIKEVIPKGVSLTNNREEGKWIYYLQEGLCALVRDDKNGEEVIYNYYQNDEILGGTDFSLSEEESTKVHMIQPQFYFITKTKSILYKIPYEELNRLVEEKPRIALLISKCISVHFHEVLRHFHEANDEYTHVRICKFLLSLTKEIEGEYVLDKHFTYIEIAKYLGVHSVTVARIMLEFKKRGIIEKRGHITIVRDKNALVEMINNPDSFRIK